MCRSALIEVNWREALFHWLRVTISNVSRRRPWIYSLVGTWFVL